MPQRGPVTAIGATVQPDSGPNSERHAYLMAAARSMLFLALTALASASSVVQRGSHKPLAYWTKEQRVSAETEHEVVVAVRQRNLDRVEAALADVSDPRSPRFRAHWTPAQLRAATMGNGSDARAAIAWLVADVGARVTRSSVASEFVRAKAPVGAWERALGCEFHWYARAAASARHDDAGRVARCDGDYALPSSVSPHVSAIFSVSNLPPRVSRGARRRGAAGSPALGNAVTPAVLDEFYAIDSNAGSKLASQAVFETSGQTFSPDDLATFEKAFGLPPDAVDTDVGGHSSDSLCKVVANECTEANLDVQYMMAVSQGTPMTYYYVDSASDPFLAFAEALASMAEPILVSSISYGSVESDNTASVMAATNAEAMKLGLLGGSIFVSSGDDGVTNYATTSKLGCAYNPSYPATCPYVTAVGATYASSWAAPGEGEIVCQSNVDDAVITSGGGFSATFAAPNYTTSAVAGYFENVATAPLGGYAAGGRGYPDVALAGYGYEVVIGGATYSVSGTSCSAPAVAGMASLVNAIRLEAGAGSVGFLNPTLYADAGAFANDVTEGENNCVAEDAFCCDEGFHAAEGWDPATGFGSVDYAKFEALLTADLGAAAVAAAKARLAAAPGRA